ncbi:single-stranded-DNA-specific exonuclease RecJ [Candidatus Azambacteria bacterium]|nr:single-stranded-DNA-specific exonuclease RecJ [Candidatus Azambacteria bacterium]
MTNIWKIYEKAPDDILNELSGYPKIISQILYNRGIKKKEEAHQFFNPDYQKDLKDPFLIFGLKKAVERIILSIEKKERIMVYHDYDADGVCGSIVVASTLRELGVDFKTYTPDRQKDGYGLNKKAIEEIVKNGVDLLITVDCGITNAEEVELLNGSGVDVIIIDHHLPSHILPKAYATVNPKQKECSYEFKDMCAAGVAFKVSSALLHSELGKKRGVKEGFEKWLLDVVAIATIADMMPLLGENRTLVKYGLLVIKKTKRIGLKKLIERALNSKNGITSSSVAFQVAPKINATSRMTHASVSYELLSTESEDLAERLLESVESANNDRRKFVDKAVKDAIFWIEKEISEKGEVSDAIVIGSDEWTPGIVGLVSSRLTERYNRPSFVYGRVGNILKGSCRSINGFNIVEIMDECAQRDASIFKAFGGHAGAGGFSIFENKIQDFKKNILEISKANIKDIPKQPILNIEAEILPEEINYDTYNFIPKFEPFGQGNNIPIFLARGLLVADAKLVGNGSKHLKLKLKSETKGSGVKFFDAVGFNMPEFYGKIAKGGKVDIVFTIEENEWNGRKSLQLKLKDIKLS